MRTERSPWDTAVCPSCGWTGSPHSLKKYRTCPKCKDYEGVSTVRKMLHWDEGDSNAVSMPQFLGALQRLGLLHQEDEHSKGG